MDWWILAGGGILFLIGGMIYLIADHNSDFDFDSNGNPAWAYGINIYYKCYSNANVGLLLI